MSDFLTRLAGRILGTAPLLRPWTPSRFATGPGLEATERFSEVGPHPFDAGEMEGSAAERARGVPGDRAEGIRSREEGRAVGAMPEPRPLAPLASPILPPRREATQEETGVAPPFSPNPPTEATNDEGEVGGLPGPSHLAAEEPRSSRVTPGVEPGNRHPHARRAPRSSRVAAGVEAEPRSESSARSTPASWRTVERAARANPARFPPSKDESPGLPELLPMPRQPWAGEGDDGAVDDERGTGAALPRRGSLEQLLVDLGEQLAPSWAENEARSPSAGEKRDGEEGALNADGEPSPPGRNRPSSRQPRQEPEPQTSEPSVRTSLVPRATREAIAEASRAAVSAAGGSDETEPTIEITIGRIEVKSPPQPPAPPAPPARPARQGPRVSLAEYLRRRKEGR